MTSGEKWALAGAAILVLMMRGKQSSAKIDAYAPQDFERPTWGANWISNQWAMVMQGQLASTGQIKAGGYL